MPHIYRSGFRLDRTAAPLRYPFTATEGVPNPAILFLVAALMGRMGADLVFHTFFMSLLLKSVTEFNFKKTN